MVGLKVLLPCSITLYLSSFPWNNKHTLDTSHCNKPPHSSFTNIQIRWDGWVGSLRARPLASSCATFTYQDIYLLLVEEQGVSERPSDVGGCGRPLEVSGSVFREGELGKVVLFSGVRRNRGVVQIKLLQPLPLHFQVLRRSNKTNHEQGKVISVIQS